MGSVIPVRRRRCPAPTSDRSARWREQPLCLLGLPAGVLPRAEIGPGSYLVALSVRRGQAVDRHSGALDSTEEHCCNLVHRITTGGSTYPCGSSRWTARSLAGRWRQKQGGVVSGRARWRIVCAPPPPYRVLHARWRGAGRGGGEAGRARTVSPRLPSPTTATCTASWISTRRPVRRG